MCKSNKKKQLFATALVFSFLMQQSLFSEVLASDISGVVGNNGVFNINPSDIKGDMGFRKYENFTLSKGDVANLIFKYGKENVSQFVNLVDNTININGLVNTVRDGKFFNGNAIFVSPNGMIVGESGVLNVGSLSVYTPNQSTYNSYLKNNYTGDISKLEQGNANVVINGKVISNSDINILSKDTVIGVKGGLVAGGKNNQILTSNKATDILFNSLVNTDNVKAANSMAYENGNIVIKTSVADGGINIAGVVKNNENGNITIQNNGTKALDISGKVINTNGNVQIMDRQAGINISGDVSNNNGRLAINNNKNQLNITKDSTITNTKGELRLTNKGENGQIIDGNISNNGLTLISSNAGDTHIGGNIQNQNGTLTIVSNGTGLEISEGSQISNNDKIRVTNTGKNGFKMYGDIKNNGSTALTNWSGDYIIDGSIVNENGKMNLSNASSQMHITENAKIANNGDLQIINAGDKGLTIDGDIQNSSTTNLWSVNGDMNINGTVTNSKGLLTVTNDGNALNVNKTANISNDASTVITNTGNGGLNYDGGYISSGSTIIDNKAGDANINGTLVQNGNKIVVKNSGDSLNFNSFTDEDNNQVTGTLTANNADVTVFNTGKGGTNISGNIFVTGEDTNNISVVNQNGKLAMTGIVQNENGNTNFANSGKEGIDFDETAIIKNNNGKLTISNSGENGAKIDAYMSNNGITNITNNKGNLVTNSTIENQNGKLEVVNNGDGMVIGGNALFTNNNDIKIANTGKNGMEIKGNIENQGSTAVSNWNGDMVISGKVENQNGKMNITSAKSSKGLHLTKEGQLLNNNDELFIQNSGVEGMILDGEVKNNSTTLISNNKGDLAINGLIQNKGDLTISNKGQNLSTGKDAIISNDGNTTVRNYSIGGLTLGGTFINQNGAINIDNRAGYLTMDKDAQIINRNADINITNSSGGAMNLNGSIYNLNGDDINLKNTSSRGGITLGENALVSTEGNVNMENYGMHGIKVQGQVKGNDINVGNKDSHVYLGNPNDLNTNDDTANLTATNDVNINIENGSLLNAGTNKTMIRTGKDLTINVNNGKIGVETGTSGGGYTYGPTGSQVDTTKSINIDTKGVINAHTLDSKKTNGDYVINMASKGSDMNIDHIYAAGRVILLTDKDANGKTGSILNAASDNSKANIEAKGLSLMSSDTIGTTKKPLTVNDTNYAYKSYYQAINDVNLKAQDDNYKKADVQYIISNNGNINAEFTGNARVKDTYAGGGTINVTNRTNKMNLVNKGTTPNTKDTYFELKK